MPDETKPITVTPDSGVSQAAIANKVKENQKLVQTETYDPQKRTPIKVDAPEMCPTCGQPIPKLPKAMMNHMNQYINEAGLVVVMSEKDDKITTTNGIDWYRVTGTNPETGKEESKFLPAKVEIKK